jgi:Phosphoenolpyruvate carboxylase
MHHPHTLATGRSDFTCLSWSAAPPVALQCLRRSSLFAALCREVLHHCLVHPHVNVKEYLENDPEAYTTKEEFLKPLTLIYHSLIDSGDTYIAHGRILDVIRQVPLCLQSLCMGQK